MHTKLDSPAILGRLKAETQANHNRIEKVSCMRRLFASDYSASEYRDCLALMLGFYDAVEPIIFHYLGDELRPGFLYRSKIDLLKRDLVELGLSETEIAALPRCSLKPYVNSLAQSLGVWYVLEGSTLGGQVISRQLKQQFGESASQFMHFHNGYGEHTRASWLAFCEIVEERIGFDESYELITAAKLTFDYLTDWLGQADSQAICLSKY
jgi:heme oxygenase (biliverdin-IX-beta and delta-forming)